jgi:hypothetical protein
VSYIHSHSTLRGMLYVLLVLGLASGCSSQMEPAKKAIADIGAAVSAAGADAQRYIPDQVKAVTDQLAGLKAKFEEKDYAGVVADAPAVLAKAQGLVAAKDAAVKQAAAKQAEAAANQAAAAAQALTSDWETLSATVPSAIAAVDSRVNILAKSKKLPANVTKDVLTTAQANLADAKSSWQTATSAQSAGKLGDAVAAGQQAKDKVDAALASLGMPTG